MLGSLLLTVSALHGSPKYVRYPLHELAAVADQVVVGTIDALQEKTYDLRVEKTLIGAPSATLRLRKFEDWTCAQRYAPYRVGQGGLFFVRRGSVVGAGNEGEMPRVGEGVLVPYAVRGSRCVERPIAGRSLQASWVPLADITGVLADYRASFDFQPADCGLVVGRTRATVSADVLDELSARSPFARELIEATLGCRCVRGHEPAPEEGVPRGVVTVRSLRQGRRWEPEDGLELPFAFAQSLSVASSGGRLEVAAGNPREARVALLRLGADMTVGEVEHLDAERLGWKLGSSRFGPPDFGAALARLSDLDGDGRGELAVSAPGRSFEHEERHVGVLYVVSCSRDRAPGLLYALRPEDAPEGLIDGCDFGRSLCAPGDLDGDGRSELVVSRTPDLDWSVGRGPPSSLALLFLDGEARVRRWRAIEARDVAFDGPEEFGGIFTGPGDVDGDGVPDLVLGEPLDCGAGLYRGALRVVFLGESGEVREWRRIDAEAAPTLALEPGDEFGALLAAPGDLDRDGVPDLVVAGARALWSVLLRPDGSVKLARRHALESLFPAAVEPIALAAAGTDERGTQLLLSATLGARRALGVGLTRLRLSGEGRLTAD